MNSAPLDRYPLTPIQEGMLYHHLRDSTSGVDIEQMVVEFNEKIDTGALREAWAALVRRHEALRTSFEWDTTAGPEQLVHSDVPVDWNEEDWRDLTERERAEHFAAFLENDRKRGFDLRVPPLVRFALFHFTDQASRFVWTFHHILADGQSYPSLIRAAFDDYDARRSWKIPGASPPPMTRRAPRFTGHKA